MFKGMMGLYEFVQKTDKLKRYVKEMRLYNASPFYKYIRHEFIRGRINKPDILESIEYLKILKYKYRRLSLYKLKLIQKLAKFRRKIMEIKDD